MSFLAELRRRNVFRMAGLYLVGAWLIIQIAETLLPAFDVPGWVLRALIILLAIGFLPALVFSWIYELTPEGLKRDADVSPAQSIASSTAQRMDRLILVGLVVLIALVAADRFWPRQPSGPSVEPPAVDAATARSDPAAPPPAASGDSRAGTAAPSASIAVLAFADLSPTGDQEYFADGISEEILNALAKLPGLRVAGRTSAFHFKGRNEDLREIGRTLDVAHVLEGSVRKQGERVRITAQLIRSADGFHLWSETYDGDLSDVFALQERIARSITRELQLVLTGAQVQRLVNAGTTNTEAYALYLQASAIFNRRQGPRYAEAAGMLEQAIALDPGFARAYARLASLHTVARNYSAGDFAETVSAAERHARRAIELDPTLAEPHAALGLLWNNLRRHQDGREALAQALALDPNDITSLFWQGVTLVNTGYRKAGNAAFDQVLALDPLLPNALNWRARGYADDGDIDMAERMAERASDAGLSFAGLTQSWLALQRGDREAATRLRAEGLAPFSADFPAGAADSFAPACFGDPIAKAKALALIDAYLAGEPAIIAGIVPYVLIRSGEVGRGLLLMQDRPTSNDSLVFGDLLRPLTPEAFAAPEFPEFLRRTGLAAHWDRSGPPDHCRKAANGDWVCG